MEVIFKMMYTYECTDKRGGSYTRLLHKQFSTQIAAITAGDLAVDCLEFFGMEYHIELRTDNKEAKLIQKWSS